MFIPNSVNFNGNLKMKFSISAVLLICVTFGCCSVPKDLILAIDDNFYTAKAKLEAINSQKSGRGLLSEMYFDDESNQSKAMWYLLPDNTLLGINTLLQDADDVEKGKITKILLGEIGTGFRDKIHWDMQVKTHFHRLNLADHTKTPILDKTIVLEVGHDYAEMLKSAKNKGCNDSEFKYDYTQNENVKYNWLQLPDKTIVQLCGFRDKSEKYLKLVDIKVCNSGVLFERNVESWYSARSVRITDIGKKLWGIDIQSSYFNIYKGMLLSDALKTMKLAKCDQILSKDIDDLMSIRILSNRWDKEILLKREFFRFQINENTELLIFTSVPVIGAYKKVDCLYAITEVPDLKTSKSECCLVEFEFIDLVEPFMSQWFEQID